MSSVIRPWRTAAIVAVLVLGISAIVWYSVLPPAIEVAIVTRQTGGWAVGASGINAATLYIEEHPDSPIRIRPVDDRWEPERAKAGVEAAIAAKVKYFVTSHPSSCAVAIAPLFAVRGQRLAMVTASTTPVLLARDDASLRTTADASVEQRALAQFVHGLPGRRLLVVQDDGNLPYTAPAWDSFAATLTGLGGWELTRVLLTVSHFDPAALSVSMAGDFDMLYILAGSYQPAIGSIAQLFNYHHPAAPILLTPWTRASAILDIAGPALQRMILPSQYPAAADDPAIRDYRRRFAQRFGYLPYGMSYAIQQALELYDAAFAAGARTPAQVHRWLLATSRHETSLGPISFDRFGDLVQTYHFIDDLQRELQ